MVLTGPVDRSADRIRAVPRGVLRSDPAARAALHHVPVGSGGGEKLQDLLATRPSVEQARRLRPARRSTAMWSSTTCQFGYRPDSRSARRHARHRAGRDVRAGGRDRRRQVHDREARHRFYDPTRGTCLDGHDLRDVTLASLRRQLGVVPQEPFLFAGTLRDNAAFARPDATDEEVHEACRAVGLDELVDRLPQGLDSARSRAGYDPLVGRTPAARVDAGVPRTARGCWCSTRPPSNLDLRSEARSSRALDALLDGRTAILIAHRLAHRHAGRPHRRGPRRPHRGARLATTSSSPSDGRYAATVHDLVRVPRASTR